MVIAMATVSLSPQQYQQMIDRIAGLESILTNLQSHRVSARADPCGRVGDPTVENSWDFDESASDYLGYFPETGAEGGAFKALSKCMGSPSEHHDWSLQRWTSSHESGREICWTATVDLGNSMRSRRVMCSEYRRTEGSQHGGPGLVELRAVRAAGPQDD